METVELQLEIKSILAKLKWSQKKLARVIYTELNEIDNEEEIGKFQEVIKKDLSRPTTKPERLIGYLRILSQQGEFRKLDMVAPCYVESKILSRAMEEGMKNISEFISQLAN